MLGYVGFPGVISDDRVEGHGLYTERLAPYPSCPDAQPFKLEEDILGHGG
jgi:hypothetical protein